MDCMVDLVNDTRTHLVETHMCRFGMSLHLDSRSGDHGLVKKPRGFLTSARFVAEQLNRKCRGDHDHVQLVGGRAAAAQMYPEELCQAMLRGIARQKREDSKGRVSTSCMSGLQTRRFIGSLSSTCVGTVKEVIENGLKGQWPSHWVHPVHEEDAGDDKFGLRPQQGIDILKKELDALTFKDWIAVAKDDVSGKELVPALVKAARAEEMAYFKKLGVYRIVPRSHARITGGKVIGTRLVDVNKGDSEQP